MTKLITASLYFHLAALYFSLSFPILKTFFSFRRDSIFERKMPKGLLKPWQKFELVLKLREHYLPGLESVQASILLGLWLPNWWKGKKWSEGDKLKWVGGDAFQNLNYKQLSWPLGWVQAEGRVSWLSELPHLATHPAFWLDPPTWVGLLLWWPELQSQHVCLAPVK